MRTLLASGASRLDGRPGERWSAQRRPDTAVTPTAAAAPRENENGISLTPDDAAEAWTFSVMPLPPKGDGQPASHAVLFIGILETCTTPRAFPIVFVIDGERKIAKQGALLSRQPADGGCVDALATVFPEGAADALAAATRWRSPSRRRPSSWLRRISSPPAAPGAARTGASRRRHRHLDVDPQPAAHRPAARAAAQEATRLNERAIGLVGAGRLKEARQAAEAAVAAEERAFGPDHSEVGEFLINLGMIERRLGNEQAAVAHYERAIRLLEPRGPSEALGIVLDNLGRILQQQKNIEGAFAVTSRAVEVLTAVLGPTHMHVGYAINNLALLWDAKGDKAKAAETCDRAIDILVRTMGPDDPRLAPFLEDQRTLRRKAGRE